MTARPGEDEVLEAAHDELRRLMREYQRPRGTDEGRTREAKLLEQIRAVGRRIAGLRRAGG